MTQTARLEALGLWPIWRQRDRSDDTGQETGGQPIAVLDAVVIGDARMTDAAAEALLVAMLAAIGLRRGENATVVIIGADGMKPALQHTPARVIIVFGQAAAQTVLGTQAVLEDLRGTVHRHQGVPLVVTYHPAYLLRSPAYKKAAWGDLRVAQQQIQTTP
ncbi:MAG: hypothetical protein D4R70_03925 [Betaproteobacteria bacterium]|nr:MAG: hypothetical protein D4R70_03925 [Betaproteobacteria bacterium]